ncbi:uncharacterized protein BO72DRAFT_451569 [Aspergillus fijiensis CBS 313.89]|uniref:Uncharacterized protein n=1 Tax=Aspergillus fijiensis CBS 313.89 TaxID=1448319 RepID=A0A8G1RHW9_9EURO|nr:uncharacterized protein BO72DRAFT_451569 [Aspergillus fijiensis CBS 313.89]RAK73569.1 hypothetical protein BO72DRAFT_451569 [Aspergillus fijiensis CBS 313.89]
MFLSCDSTSSGRPDLHSAPFPPESPESHLPSRPRLARQRRFALHPRVVLPPHQPRAAAAGAHIRRLHARDMEQRGRDLSSPELFEFQRAKLHALLMHEADLCCLIDSAKALRKFTYTIGGRMLPEGGKITVNVSPLVRSLWRHRLTLEELDLDVEDNVSWGEVYGAEGLELTTEELDHEDDEEYQEAWAEELTTLDVDLKPPPADISLADFPKLLKLSLGPHTLCFLARGIGPSRWRGEPSSSFSLVDRLPRRLEVLRIYGRGEEGDDPWSTSEICSPDLYVDAELVRLMAEKQGKLPTLKVDGFAEVISRGRDVPDWAGEDHPLVWKQPVGWAC